MVLRISTASIPHRKEFISANKHADETLKNWYDRLKVLAVACDYGTYSEAFILNQFICGLDALILEYFRTEVKDLSVNDVFDLTKSIELVDVKQVLVSIKSEEFNLSDDEHYNDHTFSGSDDDEQGTEVDTARLNDAQTEENGVNVRTRKDNIQPIVPLLAEKTGISQEPPQLFECYFCHKTFKTAGKLAYHFTCCHSTRKPSKSTLKRTNTLPSSEPPSSYECYLCHKLMKTVGHLIYHYNLYHTIGKTSTCILCGKWVNDSSNMVRHLNSHLDEKDYRCDKCDAGLKTQLGMKKHLLSHSDPNVKKFMCTKCPKVFIAKKQLKQHLDGHKRPAVSLSEKLDSLINKRKEQMTNDGKYKCDVCATQFNKESELKAHAKVHNENKLLCHLCGAKLMTKRNLIVHYLVHTKQKPFQCDECGKRFSTSTKCKRHVRNHAGTVVRPHKCTHCDKAFIQKGHLADHMKLHFRGGGIQDSRFKCDQCPKHFFKEDQLTRHKLVHVGITRPWKCNFCEKCFKTNYLRVEHERNHTGERPYVCPICGKNFGQQSSLRGHRKIHLRPPKPPSGRTKKKRKQKTDSSIGNTTVQATDA